MLYGHLARGGRAGTRLAAVFHSTLLHSLKERLQMLLYTRLFNRCDLLIYVCESQRRFWRQHGLHPPDTVVANGIDADFFTDGYTAEQRLSLRNSLELDANDYVVGLCSKPCARRRRRCRSVARDRESAVNWHKGAREARSSSATGRERTRRSSGPRTCSPPATARALRAWPNGTYGLLRPAVT